jgi:hypothetical protein
MDRLLGGLAASVSASALVFAFASCGGGTTSSPSAPAPTPTVAPALSATPMSIKFNLEATPAPITLKSNVLLGPSFEVSVSQPTLVGASVPTITGPETATFTLYPIAQGNGQPATVTVTDWALASVTISKTQEVCGRPPGILPGSRLIYPARGSKNVPVTIGILYFSVIERSRLPAGGGLHLIVGQHGTQEGGNLVSATPPPGTKIPPPPQPPEYQHLFSATVPTLQAGAMYRTQVWNDPCQVPVLTGGFST